MTDNKKPTFSINNWENFQHYKQRNPPWIKLHRDILTNYDFLCLQDASKLHLMLIWLLASSCDNKIPADPVFLKKVLHLDEEPDLKALYDAGFIDCASDVLAKCSPSRGEESRDRGEFPSHEVNGLVLDPATGEILKTGTEDF